VVGATFTVAPTTERPEPGVGWWRIVAVSTV